MTELPSWILRQLPDGIERRQISVAGHSIHVMEFGEGQPVFMLHGNPAWGFLYRKVMAALRGQPVRCIVPDLVGLGLSDKPRDLGVHTLENHAAWIGGLIDALALDDMIFVGQDWGGPIGMLALAERLERVSGMVILNTVLGPPRPGFRPTLFHRLSQFPVLSDALFRGLQFPQLALWLAQGDRSTMRGEVARAYRWPLRHLQDRAAPLALARMVPDSMEHPSIAPLRRCQEVAESFKGPMRIVWGDRDPVLGRVIGWLQRLLPHAEVKRTQAGHFLQEEVPGDIANAITSLVNGGANARASG
ncbi:alpha/beta fold hydrolase [Archangium lipolyticum]|uniref:alpha/beta fold hydrolase n=1 Tax=Archangium lipolyticum TaxID=2970465 RepID=UPI002149A85D|nr:alpha/beta fold hydrolase [Archangium lipolyticum]